MLVQNDNPSGAFSASFPYTGEPYMGMSTIHKGGFLFVGLMRGDKCKSQTLYKRLFIKHKTPAKKQGFAGKYEKHCFAIISLLFRFR